MNRHQWDPRQFELALEPLTINGAVRWVLDVRCRGCGDEAGNLHVDVIGQWVARHDCVESMAEVPN